MKKINFTRFGLTFLFILGMTVNASSQSNYYVSASSGNDSNTGKSKDLPWKTVSKVSSATLVAGDSIFFERGSIFYGTLTINYKIGTSAKPIIYTAYGTGNLPVIRASVPVTSWSLESGSIWKTTLSAKNSKRIPSLYIDGISQQLGREPNYNSTNGGFRVIKTHSTDNTSISEANTLPYTDNRFQGGEITIRTLNDLVKSEVITSHTGAIVNFSISSTSDAAINTIRDNYGYFFQNHVNTLDQQGEWAHNISTSTLYLYSTKDPNTLNVEVPSATVAVDIKNNSKYVIISSLQFENGLTNVISLNGCTNVNINNCTFRNGSEYIALGFTMTDITFENNILNGSNNVGMRWEGCNGLIFRNNIAKNIGTRAGMGGTSYISYTGVRIIGSGTGSTNIIENNIIDSIGYHALNHGSGIILMRNNNISNYCMVKDDGGGIYSAGNRYNNIITKNIVHDAPGALLGLPAGADPKTAGIYVDNDTQNHTVTENTVYNVGAWGIMANLSGNNVINDNTIYNCGSAIVSSTYSNNFGVGSTVAMSTNNTILRNILVPKTSVQYCATYNNKITATDFGTFLGTVNNNYYCQVFTGGKVIKTTLVNQTTDYTLSAFKLAYNNYETTGMPSPLNFSTGTDPNSILKFEVNATGSDKLIDLGTVKYLDPKSKSYQTSVTLPAYSSLVLINNGVASSVEENKSDENIKIYPSIATDKITIQSIKVDDTIEIYNISGIKVISKEGTSETESIIISNLQSGMYIIMINGAEKQKFMKK